MKRYLNLMEHALVFLTRRWRYHVFFLLVLTTVVFLASSIVLLEKSLSRETESVLDLTPDITVTQYTLGRQVPIEKNRKADIMAVPGVDTVTARTWAYYQDPYSGALFTVWAVTPRQLSETLSFSPVFSKGGFWPMASRGKVTCGEGVSKALMLNGRKNFALRDAAGQLVNFEVSGVFKATASLIASDLIFMDILDFYDFFRLLPTYATDLAVKVANPAETPVIARKIQNRYPDCRIILREQVRQTYAAVLSHRAGLLLHAWSSCVITFLILLWFKGTWPGAAEIRAIGLQKAVGWSSADVMTTKLFEAGLISSMAVLFGYGAAYGHLFWLNAPLFKPAMYGWAMLYPDFPLYPAAIYTSLFLVFMVTVLPYTGVTVMAAWKATAMDPAELLIGGGK